MPLIPLDSMRKSRGPILVTGHTGFKGTWMCLLLKNLGFEVIGLSLPAVKNSLNDRIGLKLVHEGFIDIRDRNRVKEFVLDSKPSLIFHFAAQPLVIASYKNPLETFETNILGTINIIESAITTKATRGLQVITTDKVYRNDNFGIPFREFDALEGKDPYSASKVGVEAVVAGYQSLAKSSNELLISTVRAGNVVGGGDWSEDRLLPDLVRGFSKEKTVQIRNPDSSRPWQHVLDPLFGYIKAMDYMLTEGLTSSFNFGPEGDSLSVGEAARIAVESWGRGANIELLNSEEKIMVESKLLGISAEHATQELGWKPIFTQEAAIQSTMQWWKKCFENGNPQTLVESEISQFLQAWTN